MSYFDDLGALTPSELTHPALNAIKEFLLLLMIFPNGRKTDLGEEVVFLGLLGFFPNPTRDMALEIKLPQDKKDKWITAINGFLGKGTISKDQLDSLIGRLSFSQTSLFGRFGRHMMTPIHTKANACPYTPTLSDRDVRTLHWWATALRTHGVRTVGERPDRPDMIVFTDAATSTAIIAAVTFDRNKFLTNGTVTEVCKSATGKY